MITRWVIFTAAGILYRSTSYPRFITQFESYVKEGKNPDWTTERIPAGGLA